MGPKFPRTIQHKWVKIKIDCWTMLLTGDLCSSLRRTAPVFELSAANHSSKKSAGSGSSTFSFCCLHLLVAHQHSILTLSQRRFRLIFLPDRGAAPANSHRKAFCLLYRSNSHLTQFCPWSYQRTTNNLAGSTSSYRQLLGRMFTQPPKRSLAKLWPQDVDSKRAKICVLLG